MTIQFQVGTTYSTRSVCDHNCIFSITVKSRTAKTIKTECGKTLRVSEYNGAEQVRPEGRYSMAPIITATEPPLDRLAREKADNIESMLTGAEFKELFSAEQQAGILGLLKTVLQPVAAQNPQAQRLLTRTEHLRIKNAEQPVSTAQVYDFSAYRKR